MLYEFLIILGVNYLGEIFSKLFHLPVPGTVNGLILLFIFLLLKIIKLEKIQMVGNFLVANMVITFIPPSVKLIDQFYLLKSNFLKLIIILLITTLITMIVTALTVDFLMNRGEKKWKN